MGNHIFFNYAKNNGNRIRIQRRKSKILVEVTDMIRQACRSYIHDGTAQSMILRTCEPLMHLGYRTTPTNSVGGQITHKEVERGADGRDQQAPDLMQWSGNVRL